MGTYTKLKQYRSKRQLKDTPEPAAGKVSTPKKLLFVIQKHHASHLHYDFRLELDGVLKSWAVPKGPSMDPSVKRLAIQVEDHPYDYKDFEGNIPKGNYGAGSVMIWDEGTYDIAKGETKKEKEQLIREKLKEGHLEIILSGKKIKGTFALVRSSMGDKDNTWLLIKKKDDFATKDKIAGDDISVKSGRTMDEIANRNTSSGRTPGKKGPMPKLIHPMLAFLIKAPFDKSGWIYEIKWDGYRALAQIEGKQVLLYSRNQQPFNSQFSEIVQDLKKLKIKSALLDGEVVVLDKQGKAHFHLIQNYHRTQEGQLYYYVFDILYYSGHDLRALTLLERKKILKELLNDSPDSSIRYSDHISEKGCAFFKKAAEQHIEGIVAKDGESRYQSKRSRDWLKIKTQNRQEFVIGGFTEPRGSRLKFGALLVGVYKDKKLHYAGHVGGGFTEATLREVYEKLVPITQVKCPFVDPPHPNSPVEWVKPLLVCEVSFTEWTQDNAMRHPVFLGMRTDKKPRTVIREA